MRGTAVLFPKARPSRSGESDGPAATCVTRLASAVAALMCALCARGYVRVRILKLSSMCAGLIHEDNNLVGL
jgi:hypothetical protein